MQREILDLARKVTQHGDLAKPFDSDLRIPRTLHFIRHEGMNEPDAKVKRWLSQSCKFYHQHWTQLVWTIDTLGELVRLRYPQYLDAWKAFEQKEIMRSDFARLVLLDTYGGVYLDNDILCYKATDRMLVGYDVVLQGSLSHEGVTNALSAGVAGAAIFRKAMDLASVRILEPGRQDDPIYVTGPLGLADAFHGMTGIRGWQWERHYNHTVGEHVYMVWPIGTWYLPCFFGDNECFKSCEKRERERPYSLRPNLAGRHMFKGSWV